MKSILIFVLAISGAISSAQSPQRFTLKGTINADSGTVSLIPVTDSVYYLAVNDSSFAIERGHFTVAGTIGYPSAYIIGVRQNSELRYISDIFFVEGGVQSITCDIDSIRETPEADNSSMVVLQEYHKQLQGLPGGGNTAQRDSILARLAADHKSSYVPLWLLIRKLPGGYRLLFDTVFAQLSPSVQHSKPGMALKKRLASAHQLRAGSKFPKLTLVDTAARVSVAPRYPLTKRYILVDFWFSHCAPCLGQFPAYTKLYSKYRDELEIIAISTDVDSARGDWKRVITEKGLKWPQYRDVGGNAAALSIQFFPTNFLLDGSGTIIKRDVSPQDLQQMLEQR